jgi:hypothetical protein
MNPSNSFLLFSNPELISLTLQVPQSIPSVRNNSLPVFPLQISVLYSLPPGPFQHSQADQVFLPGQQEYPGLVLSVFLR